MATVGVRAPRAVLAALATVLVSAGGSAACSSCSEDLACDDPSTAETFVGAIVEVDGAVVTFEQDDGTTVDVEVLGDVGELEMGAAYRVPTRPSGDGGLPRAAVEQDCACEPFISRMTR